MKQDPRIQRTRQLLHEALLALIVEKGYDAITVQDVLERAGVARSSFYAHFKDKEDLLFDGFRDSAEAEPENIFGSDQLDKNGNPLLGHWLFQHVHENKMLATTIFSEKVGSIVTEHLRNMLVVHARQWVQRNLKSKDTQTSQEPVVQFLVGALHGMVLWWVRNDFPHTADEMSGMYRKLVMNGLASSLATIRSP